VGGDAFPFKSATGYIEVSWYRQHTLSNFETCFAGEILTKFAKNASFLLKNPLLMIRVSEQK